MNTWAILYVIASLIQTGAIPAHSEPVPAVEKYEPLPWQADAVRQWQRAMRGVKPKTKTKRRRKH